MKSDFFHYLGSASKSLPNIILISGDEPFQKEYILQALLKLAEDKSLEIVRHSTENKLETEWLYSAATNLSLFNDQRLFIIRLNKLPEASTQKLLADFFNNSTSEDYFVLILPKLPAKSLKQRWYQLIEKKGLHIPVWQPNISDAIRILKYKTLQEKINIDHDAIMLLAHSYEGNMLAACQLLDKIVNITPNKENVISLEDVKAQLSSSRRYDVFNLADMLLLGQAGKVVQILNNLEKSGAEPSIILWALTKEARILIKLKSCELKADQQKVFQSNQIWAAKQKNYIPALNRLTQKQLYQIIEYCHHIDLCIKGLRSDNLWMLLQNTCFIFTTEYNSNTFSPAHFELDELYV